MAYDNQGNAEHYDSERIQSINIFEQTFGTLAVMYFCEINALKYRLRAGRKKSQPLEQEILKANWYEKAAKFYFEKLIAQKGIDGIDAVKGVGKHPLPWKEEK